MKTRCKMITIFKKTIRKMMISNELDLHEI
jgi:hypothetical protein